jgi:hypothetical protein
MRSDKEGAAMKTRLWTVGGLSLAVALLLLAGLSRGHDPRDRNELGSVDQSIERHAREMLDEGRHIFRFDTFGDEAFWGEALQLHQAIQGEALGGVGPGVSPRTALAVGLKVDVDALPRKLANDLRKGRVDLDDPRTTLALVRLEAVAGVTGFFNPDGTLRSIGIQCALCHSTVDDSLAPGIGHRLDGWANRDLDVGAIVALARTSSR